MQTLWQGQKLCDKYYEYKIDLNRSALAINGGQPLRTKPWLDNFTTGTEEKMLSVEYLTKDISHCLKALYS